MISADSPRFLGFIPAAPTKAALSFDMLVSCASIQGISWLEAAGAIEAENQVLRLIVDRAGLPGSAGGCFVSGGSAANLSALVVAREVAKRRAGGSPRRFRVAISADAHSSITNALRILEMDALIVHTDDHRLTGGALRAAIGAYTEAIEAAIGLARAAAEDIRGRPYLELIRGPELSVVLFRRRGWIAEHYARWADQLLADQLAFMPPSAWQGETVARFAFLHPQTPLTLVSEILDRMA